MKLPYLQIIRIRNWEREEETICCIQNRLHLCICVYFCGFHICTLLLFLQYPATHETDESEKQVSINLLRQTRRYTSLYSIAVLLLRYPNEFSLTVTKNEQKTSKRSFFPSNSKCSSLVYKWGNSSIGICSVANLNICFISIEWLMIICQLKLICFNSN